MDISKLHLSVSYLYLQFDFFKVLIQGRLESLDLHKFRFIYNLASGLSG